MTAITAAAPPLKLGFLSPHNPHDRSAFSGTAHFAAQALYDHPGISLHILGPHTPPRRMDRLLRRKARPVRADEIDVIGLDAILGLVASPLLDRIAQLHPGLPLLHVTDATPSFLREAYGWGIPSAVEHLETRVAAQADITVYSSGTMARRAPADLGLPTLAPAAIPFGINFETRPRNCPEKPPLDKINLLFVGLDWARKGGDVAVAALDQILASGREADLTIVGRCPERHRRHPNIRNVGFLNKARARDRACLVRLYREAHLLVLPSRGDCTPMVVAEAMAHGSPVLATDTGGIAAQIGGPGAGRVLPVHAPPSLWAETILELTADRDAYAMMAETAFDRAFDVFNWHEWADQIAGLARQAIQADAPAAIAATG
jgi:glycosyltransferase involved in cell wall biosynthesis